MRRPTSRLARLGFGAALLAILLGPAEALADWRPAGRIGGALLIHGGDLGGAALVDLYEPSGALRFGPAVGIAALSSADAQHSRVWMPLGLGAALTLRGAHLGLELLARAGAWMGAVQDSIGLGAWLSAGARVTLALGSSLHFGAGLDAWGLLGHGSILVLAPTLTLGWTSGEP
ncbi:MAG: hypothetical protein OEY14_01180 [Myxococcales bacterium]|nr:hypothetical protein [Myxococcales bacterium]